MFLKSCDQWISWPINHSGSIPRSRVCALQNIHLRIPKYVYSTSKVSLRDATCFHSDGRDSTHTYDNMKFTMHIADILHCIAHPCSSATNIQRLKRATTWNKSNSGHQSVFWYSLYTSGDTVHAILGPRYRLSDPTYFRLHCTVLLLWFYLSFLHSETQWEKISWPVHSVGLVPSESHVSLELHMYFDWRGFKY